MIVQTSYREHGAGALFRYISRDERVRDRAGRELTDRELRGFVKQSKQHQFERDVILSPERDEEFSATELERAARETVAAWERDSDRSRGSARWVYAVHRDTDHEHVHVAMTGTKHDLYMDRSNLADLRERGRERFREKERKRERERERDREQKRERECVRGLDRIDY